MILHVSFFCFYWWVTHAPHGSWTHDLPLHPIIMEGGNVLWAMARLAIFHVSPNITNSSISTQNECKKYACKYSSNSNPWPIEFGTHIKDHWLHQQGEGICINYQVGVFKAKRNFSAHDSMIPLYHVLNKRYDPKEIAINKK